MPDIVRVTVVANPLDYGSRRFSAVEVMGVGVVAIRRIGSAAPAEGCRRNNHTEHDKKSRSQQTAATAKAID